MGMATLILDTACCVLIHKKKGPFFYLVLPSNIGSIIIVNISGMGCPFGRSQSKIWPSWWRRSSRRWPTSTSRWPTTTPAFAPPANKSSKTFWPSRDRRAASPPTSFTALSSVTTPSAGFRTRWRDASPRTCSTCCTTSRRTTAGCCEIWAPSSGRQFPESSSSVSEDQEPESWPNFVRSF